MPSLKANFSELVLRIRQGRALGHAGFEPVYYLVFAPSEILEVKRSLPGWQAQLHMDGWEVHRFSIAEEIAEIFRRRRPIRYLAPRRTARRSGAEESRHAHGLGQDQPGAGQRRRRRRAAGPAGGKARRSHSTNPMPCCW